jgi:hypothetical protein
VGIKSFQIQEGFYGFLENLLQHRGGRTRGVVVGKINDPVAVGFFLRRSEIFSNFLTLRLPQSVII